MKLSAYHKAKTHTVEWWNAKGRYDLVYKSRVFTDTYSKDTITVTTAEQVIEQLIRSRAWVDFSQGLDIRLVNRDNVSLLNRVRIKAVHFAWDNPDEDLTGYFQRFLDLTAIKSSRQRRVYVLTNYGSTHEQDLYRVNTLRAMGFDPYVMIYERPTAPPVTRHLQRWVNNKRLFYAVPRFEDYIPGRKEV